MGLKSANRKNALLRVKRQAEARRRCANIQHSRDLGPGQCAPPHVASEQSLIFWSRRTGKSNGNSGENRGESPARAVYTESMVTVDPTPRVANDPKSVKVNLTTGSGVEIVWKDGHPSAYTFKFLRDACPCALCEDERGKTGRKAGEPEKTAPGALPMFKPATKALAAEAVGKYALKFSWSDNHDLGIYSWAYLREICPCGECKRSEK